MNTLVRGTFGNDVRDAVDEGSDKEEEVRGVEVTVEGACVAMGTVSYVRCEVYERVSSDIATRLHPSPIASLPKEYYIHFIDAEASQHVQPEHPVEAGCVITMPR